MLSKVMIVAGESSGELYGALLATELLRQNPHTQIKGVGGHRMAQAGVSLISEISSSFGLTEAVKTFLRVRETFYKVIDELKTFCPDVIVLIDYPDFNIRLAVEAKKYGCKILYFVSPQVWAWRQSRIYKIATNVDKMAAILPFEPEIYKPSGLDCRFVGHPVFDELKNVLQRHGFDDKVVINYEIKARFKTTLGLHQDAKTLVLMPGSRRHEVMSLFDSMLKSANRLRRQEPDLVLLMPIAQNLPVNVKEFLADTAKENNIILCDDSMQSLIASDIAVIASGTSSLQATFTMTPMVVVYKVSFVTYLLARMLVKVNHISITNIILDWLNTESPIRIKELLQGDVTEQKIFDELCLLMHDSQYRQQMLKQFDIVVNQFAGRSAIKQTAQMLNEMV